MHQSDHQPRERAALQGARLEAYRTIQIKIDNELAAQDDNGRLYRKLPTVQDQMRLLALYMEALEFWQSVEPTDYCLDNRRWIDASRNSYRRKVAELSEQFGFKVEMQVIVEQLPLMSQSLRQQLTKVRP